MRRFRYLLPGFKLALAVALVYWLLASGRLELQAYGPLLTGPQGILVACAVIVQFVAFNLFIARWRDLVHVQGIPITWPGVFATGYRGLFTQLAVPGGIGADGVRILYLRSLVDGGLVAGFASVIVDRVIGLASLVAVGLTACFLIWIDSGKAALLPLLGVCVAVVVLGIAAVVFASYLPRLALRLRGEAGRRLKTVVEAMMLYRGKRKVMLTAFFVSALGQMINALAAWIGLMALGADSVSYVAVLAINCLLNLIRMVPLTPMGLGVTDLASESLFQIVDIGLGAELQMLQRLISVLIFCLCGLAFFWSTGSTRQR